MKEQIIEKFIAFFGENAVNYGTSDYITMGLRPYDRADFKSDSGLAEQLARYRAMRDEWTALDILRLDDVPAYDRLRLVLREELIDEPVLHEFACRRAERALSLVCEPDKRSIAAIETKRAWLRGECSDDDLAAARAAAWDAECAASSTAAWDAAWEAAWDAASAAVSAAERDAESAAANAARSAAWAAACAAEMAAESAPWAAESAERAAALDDERERQVAELVRMLEGD